jgi:hypothetical protein
MKKDSVPLFAPQFSQNVARVEQTGKFDPEKDLWVGQSMPQATTPTIGPPTWQYVLHASPGTPTNFFGEPDELGNDDWGDNQMDPGDPDWC